MIREWQNPTIEELMTIAIFELSWLALPGPHNEHQKHKDYEILKKIKDILVDARCCAHNKRV